MHPYAPQTNKGRTVAGDDIHHRTADQPRAAAKPSAKAARHAARAEAAQMIARSIVAGVLSAKQGG